MEKCKKQATLIPANPPIIPCAKCAEYEKRESALLEKLDVVRNAKGSLVMWPGTNMTGHAISAAVAGLLSTEIEMNEIKTCLLKLGIRAEGDVVGAIKRLAYRKSVDNGH